MRFFYHNPIYICAVLKHILKVYKVTVMKCILSKVICIMEMNYSFIVSLNYIFGKQKSSSYICACNTCKIVTLSGYNSCVLIGVFCIPIFAFTINEFFNRLVCGVSLTNKSTLISIYDINFCKLKVTKLHKFLFYYILNVLYKHPFFAKRFYVIYYLAYLFFGCSLRAFNLVVCLRNSICNFALIKVYNAPISLNNFHFLLLLKFHN